MLVVQHIQEIRWDRLSVDAIIAFYLEFEALRVAGILLAHCYTLLSLVYIVHR